MENQKTIDFSRKCRDRVNFFFKQLRTTLQTFPRYQSCTEWSRFDILERSVEALEFRRGLVSEQSYRSKIHVDRTEMTNKELCQLYRTRLNSGFDALRSELEVAENFDKTKFRLFSRAGILEATCSILTPLSSKLNPKSRKRCRESDKISPSKIQLNDSGYESPKSEVSPSLRFQYAYMQYIQAHASQLLKTKQPESTYWRPW